MAISLAGIMAALGGNYGPDARFGVKRSKNQTADGAAVDIRLRTVPADMSADGFRAAARHGIEIRANDPVSGRYAASVNRAGIVADYIVAGAMANSDDAMMPPAPVAPEPVPVTNPDPAPADAAPADAVGTDPVGTRRNGRKPATV